MLTPFIVPVEHVLLRQLLIIYENVSDMTHTAHAYAASVNTLELPCAYACAYLTSENNA